MAFVADGRLVAHNASFDMASSTRSSPASATPPSRRARDRHAGHRPAQAPLCPPTASTRCASATASTIRAGPSMARCSTPRSWPEVYMELWEVGRPTSAWRWTAGQPSRHRRHDVTLTLKRPAPLPPRLDPQTLEAYTRPRRDAGQQRRLDRLSGGRRASRKPQGLETQGAATPRGGRPPGIGRSSRDQATGWSFALHFGDPLTEQRREVDRVDEEGREAAIAHGVGDDLPGEREQQARALDHHDGACSRPECWPDGTRRHRAARS